MVPRKSFFLYSVAFILLLSYELVVKAGEVSHNKADHRLHFARKYFSTRNEEDKGLSILSGFQRDHKERVLVSIEKEEAISQTSSLLLRNLIEQGGGQINSFNPRSIEAFIPLFLLPSLEEHPNVTSIAPLPSFLTSIGKVTSQSRKVLRVDAVTGNLSGKGINVGILSDSVNRCPSPTNPNLIGLDASIATGDLPPRARHQIIKDSSSPCGNVNDEARAMAEIIYDISPGVNFLYYMPNSPADMAAGIKALAAKGAKIIVDDIRFLGEPIYQDGVIATAVDAVAAKGVIYFSAAGNMRDFAYQSRFNLLTNTVKFDFSSFGLGTKSLYCHRFPSGSPFMKLGSNVRKIAQFFLTWAVPFYSLGGPKNPINIDLIVSSSSSSLPKGLSHNSDPWEYSSFTISSNSQISICVSSQVSVPRNFSAYVSYRGSPVLFKLQYNQYGLLNVFKGAATVVSQQNAANAITVGAVSYDKTCRANWNTGPGCVITPAAYSSRGGQELIFNATGWPLSKAANRFKPDIIGPDCGDTSFFGQDIEGNGFPNFCGSSAAAPAIAALAARIVEKCPTTTTQKMSTLLRNSATDVAPKGWDGYSGAGLVDYFKAINC